MFHPYSFYLQKHKNAKTKRESALPFFSLPLLLHLVIHTPNVPNRLSLCPISPFGVSHFAIRDVPFYLLGYPILPFGMSHFAIWGIPFCHLGCPISPFGVSHFTIWNVPFRLLGYPISPFGVYFRHICAQCTARFSVCHLRFRCKIYAFSLSIGKIDLAPFAFLHFCIFANAKLLPFGN